MQATAPQLTPTDELIELRAMIARLKRREAHLALLVEGGAPAATMPRPGWPIARTCISADTAPH